MQEDAERWNERYEGRRTGDPTPPTGLRDAEVPAPGRFLDVACGLGEQTLWAARRGFRVVALDASAVAVAALRRAAGEIGVSELVDARVHDLDDGLPSDLGGAFALVVCQRFRNPELYPQLVAVAEPGGLIVVTVLSRVGVAGPAGPYHAPAGELALAVRDLDVDIVRHVEQDGEATLVARRR